MNKFSGLWAIRNGKVLIDKNIKPCDVLIEDGQIKKIGINLQSESEIDAAGGYVLPGLIDLHTHGIGFESVRKGSLKEYARLEAVRGATAFYATFGSAPPEEIARLMERHRRETDELRSTSQIIGFRLEFPYVACIAAGVPEGLASINPATTALLMDAGGGHIKIWDISPELPGAADLIRQLSGEGIVCSIAHTRATIEQGRAAVDAGAGLVTHTFDVFEIPKMTEGGVYPAGLIDYLLTEDRVICEIIADGTHVPPLLVEKTFRCKNPKGIAFITDSNLGAGLPPGTYTLPGGTGDGDVIINGSNNGARQVNREGELAGSALTPIDSFRNAIHLFHKDIATASEVCSTTPARLMGLNKGEIAVNRDADLIILDSEFEILYTIAGGEVIYSIGKHKTLS